ncbi:hypothetical protein CXF85_18955 [Colwellia sp. 75C3]|uniref:PEP-CTERM sorting domain-containing protein n=1 Tax=Colwellia sp. 75C3 TaxID=888425 RepID=UPI000C320F4E|nr:PEP-CTERM sorting domain-containing protein [Colwellia sp. 75C3]PKG81537.1 hypothetical protein CXF85_18955 [Colwellia sp. 75C3]
MKFCSIVVFAISFFVSTNTSATLLKDVGGVDKFIASKLFDKNSSQQSELDWVIDILDNESITFDKKYEEREFTWSSLTDEDNVFFMDLGDNTPAYFLLKIGHGNGKKDSTDSNIQSHLLFKNSGYLSFAVIDLKSAGVIDNFTIGRISHVTEFSANPSQSQSTPIPEPMTISLFAIALLALTRRNRRL